MESKERNVDLSVPSVRDIEAPLGGTSTVYEIILIEGEEQFTYTKTYREIEDFGRKLQKKFPLEKFPALSTGTDVEVKREAAQTLLKFIAKKQNIISSSITQQFIGQDRSIKHIIKDRNQNPTFPPVSAKTDLFDDLFKESEYLSNSRQSNLFDDDSLELFSSKPEEAKSKPDTQYAHSPPPESRPAPTKEQIKEEESDGDEVDQLFVPRKSSLIKVEDLNCEDTEELFRVDDNLDDLLLSVTARTAAGAVPPVPAKKPQDLQQKSAPEMSVSGGLSSRKPPPPAKSTKPTLPPKPVPKPKPAGLSSRTSSSPRQPGPPTAARTQSGSDLNPADIGSYIRAAEKDTDREVLLFDD